jgi:glycosyltransferase involved in cell wall biosynthesis
MNISFIIPLKNEEATIELCLESILNQMISEDEIIVVDNGSTDDSIKNICQLANIYIIYKPEATIAAVRNAGAVIAKGDILAFIDSDCVLAQNWRDNVVKSLSDESIGATGSKVDIPDDAVWIERAWYSQRENKCSQVSYINSGNFVVRKVIFEEVGGFTEDLVTGEDSELGWRINRAGNVILNNPAIRSVHLGNPKNLKDFYKKEKWHALGMMGTFKISCIDKPVIMTVMFVVCNLFAIFSSVFIAVRVTLIYGILAFLVLTILIPAVTACYRSMQFKNYRYFFHLVCLYWIYFLARSEILFSIYGNKFRVE